MSYINEINSVKVCIIEIKICYIKYKCKGSKSVNVDYLVRLNWKNTFKYK